MDSRLIQLRDMAVGAGMTYIFDPTMRRARRLAGQAECPQPSARTVAWSAQMPSQALDWVTRQGGQALNWANSQGGQALKWTAQRSQVLRWPMRQQNRRMWLPLQALRWAAVSGAVTALTSQIMNGAGKLAAHASLTTRFALAQQLAADERVAARLRQELMRGQPVSRQFGMMKRTTSIGWTAGTLGLGAAAMFFFDPQSGSRRRSLLRDRAAHFSRQASGWLNGTAADLGERARGLMAEGRLAANSAEVSDEVLAERVRSKMGRAVSNPGSITVTAHEGYVTLSGPIWRDEVERLLTRVQLVPGVKGIENRLEEHGGADHAPGLQDGQEARDGHASDGWSPSARLLMLAAGGALALGSGALGLSMRARNSAPRGALGHRPWLDRGLRFVRRIS